MATGEHPSETTLLAYADSELPEVEQQAVEEHVAECAECAQVARQSFRFARAVGLSAKEHGDVVRRAAIEEALAREEARAAAELRERLAHWRSRWAGLAEAAASVALSAVDRGTQVAAEGLVGLTRPGSAWQLASATGGAIRGEAGTGDSALLSTPALSVGPRARVAVVGGDAPEVTIRLDGVREEDRPLVLLVSTDESEPARIQVAGRPAGASYLVARFDEIPMGTYVVAIEPFRDENEPEGEAE